MPVARFLTLGAAAGVLVAPLLALPSTAANAVSGKQIEYSVLAESDASAQAVKTAVAAAGGKVVDVNKDIGLYTVSAPEHGFVTAVSSDAAVLGAARETSIGQAPKDAASPFAVEKLRGKVKGAKHHAPGRKAGLDPLDELNWGLTMIDGDKARRIESGDHRVTVGILDTGVDASHPDIAPNFNSKLSRNFVTDIPEIDGACEFASCKDPAGWDDGAHGTHVAGIIAAASNGIGTSGVAPGVSIVNIRGGQDSGYFFLKPVVDALTYAGDVGLDVVNMSFYVDPWLYNCTANPADSPEAQAEQRTIIAAVSRALNYAHRKGVTLVSALGNENTDLGKPVSDATSPDYGGTPYPRDIDNATCLSMPTEGPHVIGVSAVGPSGRKAYYSNWGLEQISVAAPGGDFYDGLDAEGNGSPTNLILSAYPKNVAIAEAMVDPATGDITPEGEGWVVKDCKGSRCGYYQYLQGTSMASPFAAGVAALIVSKYGKVSHGSFGLDPRLTETILDRSATETACPAAVYVYPAPIPASYTATCEGGTRFNGFYGHGVVNALAAVSARHW